MIIGFLFTIKGAFNILKGLNYFIFKDNFKMIPMELTSVYKSPVSVHEITYIYCYQSIHQGTNVKYKTKGHDYKKEVIDIGDVVIYNGVTPDGDGMNDYFIIDNINHNQLFPLTI